MKIRASRRRRRMVGGPKKSRRMGGGRFNQIIVGESKSEQVGPLSRTLLSADEWENVLVVTEEATNCHIGVCQSAFLCR